MFDIGWSEMAIIAVVVLVVLGPKELPHALKTVSHWMRTARKLGSEFQSGVNEIVRDAELEDARKQLQGISKNSIEKKIEQAIDPAGDLKKAMNETTEAAKLDTAAKPAPEIAAKPIDPFANISNTTPSGQTTIADKSPSDQDVGDKGVGEKSISA
ncbi:Sec-independent protein translocase protein TatB [Dongia sp.]|uniref:Sec-independent protein translocase protein TatB n=1 Tax=Dongia sp. TaxID=1977262 RepID=UPI0035B046EC